MATAVNCTFGSIENNSSRFCPPTSYPDFFDSNTSAVDGLPSIDLSPSAPNVPAEEPSAAPSVSAKSHLPQSASSRHHHHHPQDFRSLPCIRSGVGVQSIKRNGHVTLMEFRTIAPVSIRCVRENGRLTMKSQRSPSTSSYQLLSSPSTRSLDYSTTTSPRSSISGSQRRRSESSSSPSALSSSSFVSSPSSSPVAAVPHMRKAASSSSAIPVISSRSSHPNVLSRTQTLPCERGQKTC